MVRQMALVILIQYTQEGAGKTSQGKQLHMYSFVWQCKGFKIIEFLTNGNLCINTHVSNYTPKGLPTKSFNNLK